MNGNKVILISIDGMRPDAFLSCGNEYIHAMMKNSYYTLNARTVVPSITLPCHLSMFRGVPPQRHGTLNNDYVVPVRPVKGIFERLKSAGAVNSIVFSWDPMIHIMDEGSVDFVEYINVHSPACNDTAMTDIALRRIRESHPDFMFLYMADTDNEGHRTGWMNEKYLQTLSAALDNVKRVIDACGDEYAIIVTADHGGHDRTHGTEMPEDMIIPNFFFGKMFPKGVKFEGGHLLNLVPTIAKIMGVEPSPDWDGVPVI